MRIATSRAMSRAILIVSIALASTGCVTGKKMALTDCEHDSGWCREIRAAAVESHDYAIMAVNAYNDADKFTLPAGLIEHHAEPNDPAGFAYSVFVRGERARPDEVILAFRGTEFFTREDWKYGNFSNVQNERGHELYKAVRGQIEAARLDYDLPITLTGHSLGGGISTYVSLREPGVAAYVFNTSPNFSIPAEPNNDRRLSVVERSELLKYARVFKSEPRQEYISIGCRRWVNPLSKHSSPPLASCLTRIAAWEDCGAWVTAHANPKILEARVSAKLPTISPCPVGAQETR